MNSPEPATGVSDSPSPSSPRRTSDNSRSPPLNESKGQQTTSTSTNKPQNNKSTSTATVNRVRRRNRMITSCLECRRRKLKCDKSHPCANCAKFARDCVFLAPSLDSASQLRLMEIKEKMGSLERVLEHDVARSSEWRQVRKGAGDAEDEEFESQPVPEDEKDLEPTPLAVTDAVYEEDAETDVMELGIKLGKLRLTDRLGGFFRPKLTEELSVSLKAIEEDRRSSGSTSMSPEPIAFQIPKANNPFAPGPGFLPPSSSLFFGVNSSAASLIDHLPAKNGADRLMEQYWLSVHPIARVVHRPSFQRRYNRFWEEIRKGVEPIGSLQAIVFAAWFSAAVSLDEKRVLNEFAVTKQELVDSFKQGAESALGRANLLRTTKLETMQAFIMYMIPLCNDMISRAHSALVGAAIRLAECMGLHRDGSYYAMSPVEMHVRRMVWYQISFIDLRTCEAQGPRPGIRSDEYDTKFPLNVDDDTLDSPNPPVRSEDRWTDMTLSLVRMECLVQMRSVWFDRLKLERKETSLTAVLARIERFRKSMCEKYEHLIDKSVPEQHAAWLILTLYVNKMYIGVLHRYHGSVKSRLPDRLRKIILSTGTLQCEASMAFETLPALSHLRWCAPSMQTYHTAFLLLAEVFTSPTCREAERIWRLLDYVFEMPPDLDRNTKGRLILTEIRDRLAAYRNMRRPRAPLGMVRRLGGGGGGGSGGGQDGCAKGDGGEEGEIKVGKAVGGFGFDLTEPEIGIGVGEGEAKPWISLLGKEMRAVDREKIGRGDGQRQQQQQQVQGNGNGSGSGKVLPFGLVENWSVGNDSSPESNGGGGGAPASARGQWGTTTAENSLHWGGMGLGGWGSLGQGDYSDVGSGGGGSGSIVMGGSVAPTVSDESSGVDELMADIDWNEWDKLFPPEMDTGDVGGPTSFAPNTASGFSFQFPLESPPMATATSFDPRGL